MDDKKTAYLLRKQGFSYGEINRALVRKRSKSTLSYWFKDLPFSDYQKEELRVRFAPKLAEAREKALMAKARKKLIREAEIEERNAPLAKFFADAGARKAVLGALYLANGSKKSGTLAFSSSDPAVVRLYLYLLRTSFVLDEGKFRCTVLARANQPIEELKRFWSKETAVPLEQFYVPRVDARTQGKPMRKHGAEGTCKIEYLSADLFREVMSIGSILSSSVRSNSGL